MILLFVFLAGRRLFVVDAGPPVQVVCETTKGKLEITVRPDWSPRGAERFLQLVDDGYFTKLPLFRCMSGFICQFGPRLLRAGEPARNYSTIPDDPILPELRNFQPGYLSFAGYGPNSRGTHLFVALEAVSSLGKQPWESAIGVVSDATFSSTVKKWNTEYGETTPTGHGPDPRRIESPDGEAYLREGFPNLDYFLSCARAGRGAS